MIELPRAALLADQIAEVAEFFSFGTNDLTQTTMGLSRDDAGRFLPEYVDQSKAAIFKDDPFQTLDVEGVGMLIEWAIEKGRETRPKLEDRHLRRAWRRCGEREVLPQGGHELRERVAVPRADCAAGGGAGGDGGEEKEAEIGRSRRQRRQRTQRRPRSRKIALRDADRYRVAVSVVRVAVGTKIGPCSLRRTDHAW